MAISPSTIVKGRIARIEVSETRRARSQAAVKRHDHIVDQLIAERAIGLASHWSWPVLRPALYPLLGYKRAVQMADAMADLSADDTMRLITNLLDLKLNITGLERLPVEGPFILAANHPTGIADGVAVHAMLKQVRDEISIFTNRDAVRINQELDKVLIPVEWREEHKSREKTKETLIRTNEAFDEGRAVVIFPSGRIAHWHDGALTERPWQATMVTLARRYKVPILPVHVGSRNSGMFYLFSRFSQELRDMTVFHELLNKAGSQFDLTIGQPIAHDLLSGDAQAITEALQDHTVSALAHDRDAVFSR